LLTAASHFGGAYHAGTGSFTLTWAHGRFVRCNPSAGTPVCTLPSETLRWDQKYEGRFAFVIINDGSVSLSVRDPSGNVVHALAAGKWVGVSMSSGQWVASMNGTVNAVLNASTYRVSAVANPEEPTSYDSFCLYQDVCAWLSETGNVPLTGGGGTEEVLAPFYQDVTTKARNSDREAVRAADMVMPSKVAIRLADGDFTQDTTHPLYGSVTLSTEFYDALYNRATNGTGDIGSQPHVLDYDAATSPITEKTGDWHHAALYGTYAPTEAWQHGSAGADLTAKKWIWKKTVQYGPPSNPTAYTLEIRLTMEHTLGAAVRLDPVANGGNAGELYDDLDQEHGLWGALFTLSIFTNEVEPSFVDDSTTFKPLGWTAATTWRRSNPALHGLCKQVVAVETNPETKRGVHPQCVLLAHLPTTFHAPIGSLLVSQANEEMYQGFMAADGLARNLADCSLVPNASPWLDVSGCADPIPCAQASWPSAYYGGMQNIVFGYSPGYPTYYVGKGMTLGGDMKRSKPMEWLCWVNGGAGYGLTLLKVARPGWDEACGKLSVGSGNSAEFWMCTDDGDCPRGNDECAGDAGEWPTTVGMSSCDGHPIEPYMGIGGSHTCLRTAEMPQLNAAVVAPDPQNQPSTTNFTCCIPTDDTTIGAYQYCTRYTTAYGDYNGTNCVTLTGVCENTTTFWTQFAAYLTNYTLGAGSDTPPLTRQIAWARMLPDPDPVYALRNWTYASGDADLANQLGTFTKGASTITVATVSGANPIRAQLSYDKYVSGGAGSPWDWFGCDISCRFNGVSTIGPQGIGFLDGSQNGYGLNVVKSGSDMVMQLCRYSNNTKTVISSHTFTGQGGNDTGVARFRVHGTDLQVWYTPTGQPIATLAAVDGVEWMRQALVARDPDFTDPMSDSTSAFLPSFYTENTVAGNIFDTLPDPLITDLVSKFLRVRGYAAYGEVSCTLEASLLLGYGQCADQSANYATCGSGTVCNCSSWQDSLHTMTTVSWTGTDLVTHQTFAGCVGVDEDCNNANAWEEDTVQYHGGPSPLRCSCRALPCADGTDSCGRCPDSEAPYVLFPLPTSDACWDGMSKPSCVGTTPLLCYGLDSYDPTVIICI